MFKKIDDLISNIKEFERFLPLALFFMGLWIYYSIPNMSMFYGHMNEKGLNTISYLDVAIGMFFAVFTYMCINFYFSFAKKYEEKLTKIEKFPLSIRERVSFSCHPLIEIFFDAVRLTIKLFFLLIPILLISFSTYNYEYDGLLNATTVNGALNESIILFVGLILLNLAISFFVKSTKNFNVFRLSMIVGFFGYAVFYLQEIFFVSLGMANDTTEKTSPYLIVFFISILSIVSSILESHEKKENYMKGLVLNSVAPILLIFSILHFSTNFILVNLKTFQYSTIEKAITHKEYNGEKFEYVRGVLFAPGLSKEEEVRELLVESYLSENYLGLWNLSDVLIQYGKGSEQEALKALIEIVSNQNDLLEVNKERIDKFFPALLDQKSFMNYAVLNLAYKLKNFEVERIIIQDLLSKEYGSATRYYVEDCLNSKEKTCSIEFKAIFYILSLSGFSNIDFSLVSDTEKRERLIKEYDSLVQKYGEARNDGFYSKEQIIEGLKLFNNR